MNNTPIYQQDYLDIIFAHQHKGYGAYQVRKTYAQRVWIAILIIFGIVALLAILSHTYQPAITPEIVHSDPRVVVLHPDPLVFPEMPMHQVAHKEDPPQAQPRVNTTKYTTAIEVIENHEVRSEDKILPPDDYQLASTSYHQGADAIAGSDNDRFGGDGVHARHHDKKDDILKPAKPTRVADVMPEYPGGKDALLRYLSASLRYPHNAAEAGIEGKVVLEFVVNELGEISDIKVIKGVSMGCTEEAIRVVRSMKKWRPAMKNGKVVPAYFVLPIAFHLGNG